MLPVLIVLGISTILNAIYFMKTVIRIYTPVGSDVTGNASGYTVVSMKQMPLYAVVLCAFMVLNVLLGVMSDPITELIRQGIEMFA